MRLACRVLLLLPMCGCVVGGPLGLGATKSARLRRPDLFEPGCAGRLGDKVVVCGAAERLFAEESDADLLDEARADAMQVLAQHYSASELSLAGVQVAHVWRDCGDRIVRANFTVPARSVRVLASATDTTTSNLSTRTDPCSDE